MESGERKTTYVKFPKVDKERWYPVDVNFNKTLPYVLILHKQNISGIDIPTGSEIHIDVMKFCNKSIKHGYIDVPGWALNKLLKALFVMKLKNNLK